MVQLVIDAVVEGGTTAMRASVPDPTTGSLNDFLDRPRSDLFVTPSQWSTAN